MNTALLRTLHPNEAAWDLERAGEAEMDEMWSFVGHKGNPRWLWHAIDHRTGKVLAYVFGRRKDGHCSKDSGSCIPPTPLVQGLSSLIVTFGTGFSEHVQGHAPL